MLRTAGVDLVWGNKFQDLGLDHIIDKHYVRYNHYNTLSSLKEDIIDSFKKLNEGKIKFEITGLEKNKPVISFTTMGGPRLAIGLRDKDINGKTLGKFFLLTSYEEMGDWKSSKNTVEERQRRKEEVKNQKV